MKRCTVCQIEKPREAYSKHSMGRDGLRARCKQCTAVVEEKRRERWRAVVRTHDPEWRQECPKCHEAKPADGFYLDSSKATGLSAYCRSCQIERSRHRWSTKRDECRANQRDWYRRNKSRALENAQNLRKRVLAAYGATCACCGEQTPEFLAVDHIDNDGESHRRELAGYGRSIYRWLAMNGFPKDRFQLLCHNCNMAKGLYGGCPHKGKPPGRRQKTMRWDREPAA